MKQTKFSYVRMLLIAALVLLMAFALVACNGDKKDKSDNNINTSENIEMTEASKQIVEQSRSDFDAMLNYFLTCSETLAANAQINFRVEFDKFGYSSKIVGEFAICDFENVQVCVFEKEEGAKRYIERRLSNNEENLVRVGNKVIKNLTLYQQILDHARPSSITRFTKEQVEFMESKLHRGIDKNEISSIAEFSAFENVKIGSVHWYNIMTYGSCSTEACIGGEESATGLENDFGAERFMPINYTNDSYIRLDEATGIFSFKLTYKPGWHIREILNYQYDYSPTGKYVAEYYYNEAPSTVVIPAKIADCAIYKAYLVIRELDNNTVLSSVEIEKAISEVYLSGNIKQITIPVSDEAFVSMYDNTALETINFGGTTQQWEALYGYMTQGWTHVYDYVEEKYVDVTFTVHCTNGDITYPKTNA